MQKSNVVAKSLVLFVLVTVLSFPGLGQSDEVTDSTKAPLNIAVDLSVNSNGFTPIPTFSLGRPAYIANFYVSKKRFSYDPQVLFSWDGKPWIASYWLRYKAVDRKKFNMGAGTTIAVAYSPITIVNNNVSRTTQEATRFFNLELTPNYKFSDKSSVGIFYLYGRGLEEGYKVNINFIALNAKIMNIKLSEKLAGNFIPMVYYLNQAGFEGYYASATASVGHKKYPFSLLFQFNQTLKTEIVPDAGFIWNIGLSYLFKRSFYPVAIRNP